MLGSLRKFFHYFGKFLFYKIAFGNTKANYFKQNGERLLCGVKQKLFRNLEFHKIAQKSKFRNSRGKLFSEKILA